MKELLSSVGVAVDVAETGLEALRMVERNSYDAVLMDVQMPEMDGFVAVSRLRADSRFGNLPVIAVTAHAMPGDREHCLEAGFTDYLSKPINPARLFEALGRRIGIEGHRPATPDAESTPEVPAFLAPLGAVMDVAEALRNTGDDPALLREVLEIYLAQPEIAPAIEAAMAAGDRETARREVHTLAGSSGTLGATEVRARALALEALILDGADDWRPALESLTQATRRLQSQLAATLAPR